MNTLKFATKGTLLKIRISISTPCQKCWKKIETQTENVVGGLPVISDNSSHPFSELLMAQATIAVNPQHFFA